MYNANFAKLFIVLKVFLENNLCIKHTVWIFFFVFQNLNWILNNFKYAFAFFLFFLGGEL